jgi:acetyltransferase-like isoleucine patch superfamily enzyme
VVDHDCRIGDFVHVAPGAVLGGGVMVGGRVLVGAGAVVLPGLTLGAGCTVGAGAVVTRNVAPRAVVVGVPAKARRLT